MLSSSDYDKFVVSPAEQKERAKAVKARLNPPVDPTVAKGFADMTAERSQAYKDGSITARELAKRCLDQAGGNIAFAKDQMIRIVLSDDRLFRTVMEPFVDQACLRYVSEVVRNGRKSVWESASTRPVSAVAAEPKKPDLRLVEANKANVVALATATAKSLMDFALPGGKALRSANTDEIRKAAQYYSAIEHNSGAKARFLGLVADMVPPNKIAGHVLNDATLLELRAKAEAAGGSVDE